MDKCRTLEYNVCHVSLSYHPQNTNAYCSEIYFPIYCSSISADCPYVHDNFLTKYYNVQIIFEYTAFELKKTFSNL